MKLHLFITRWCKECLLIYRQYFPDKLNSQIITDLIKSFNDVFHSAKKSKQTEDSAKIFLSVFFGWKKVENFQLSWRIF